MQCSEGCCFSQSQFLYQTALDVAELCQWHTTLTFFLRQNIGLTGVIAVGCHACVGHLTGGGGHMTGGGAAGAAAKVVTVTRGVAACALAGLGGGGGGGDAHVDPQPTFCR